MRGPARSACASRPAAAERRRAQAGASGCSSRCRRATTDPRTRCPGSAIRARCARRAGRNRSRMPSMTTARQSQQHAEREGADQRAAAFRRKSFARGTSRSRPFPGATPWQKRPSGLRLLLWSWIFSEADAGRDLSTNDRAAAIGYFPPSFGVFSRFQCLQLRKTRRIPRARRRRKVTLPVAMPRQCAFAGQFAASPPYQFDVTSLQLSFNHLG